MNVGTESSPHPFVRFIATGGYLGYAPFAPGSVGALGCVILLWFLLPEILPRSAVTSLVLLGLSSLAFIALAVWASTRAELHFGHDASRIVVDEYVGMLVAVLLLPKTIVVYAVAFVLFRIFDILKPFPARRAESLPGGVGIVMDDVIAGIYANVLVQIMLLVKQGF